MWRSIRQRNLKTSCIQVSKERAGTAPHSGVKDREMKSVWNVTANITKASKHNVLIIITITKNKHKLHIAGQVTKSKDLILGRSLLRPLSQDFV